MFEQHFLGLASQASGGRRIATEESALSFGLWTIAQPYRARRSVTWQILLVCKQRFWLLCLFNNQNIANFHAPAAPPAQNDRDVVHFSGHDGLSMLTAKLLTAICGWQRRGSKRLVASADQLTATRRTLGDSFDPCDRRCDDQHVNHVERHCHQHRQPVTRKLRSLEHEAEVTNLLKACRQHMLQEPTIELLGRHRHLAITPLGLYVNVTDPVPSS